MSIHHAEVIRLENGLRVVVDTVPHVATAAVGIWVAAGARCETPQRHGISHLLEHMAFKGTQRRSPQAIVEEIEDVGGYLNAYTSRETTVYHARLLAGDVPLAIDLLADILLNSTFDPGELAREKEVIVQEIGQCADTPEDLVFDMLQEACFGDQPLGQTILGTPETVRAQTREDLLDHLGRFYDPASLILGVSGPLKAEEVLPHVEAALGSLSRPPRPKDPSGAFLGGDQRLVRSLEQAHLAVAFPGCSATSERLFALQLLNEIYGGGMSSHLFQEVREKRGLCYSVYSFAQSYADTGLFGFYAGTSGEEVGQLLPVALGELEKLSGSVSDAELARAKAQMRSTLLMQLESLHSRLEWAAAYLQRFDRIVSPEDLIAKVDALAPADLAAEAEALLQAGPVALAGLGPVERLETSPVLFSQNGRPQASSLPGAGR